MPSAPSVRGSGGWTQRAAARGGPARRLVPALPPRCPGLWPEQSPRGSGRLNSTPLRWAVRPRAGTWEASDVSSPSSPRPGVAKGLTLVPLHVPPTCPSLRSRLGCQADTSALQGWRSGHPHADVTRPHRVAFSSAPVRWSWLIISCHLITWKRVVSCRDAHAVYGVRYLHGFGHPLGVLDRNPVGKGGRLCSDDRRELTVAPAVVQEPQL